MNGSLARNAAVVGRVALVLGVGLAPWPGVREAFDAAFRSVGNVVLSQLSCETRFGAGHAQLQSADHPSPDGASWDTVLRLSLEHVPNTDEVFVNPRRVAYLPLVMFVAVVLAAPLSLRSRMKCLMLGVGSLLLLAVLNLWITSLWLFLQIPDLLEHADGLERTAIEVGYRALVVPLSNRLVIPALLAAWLIGQELTSRKRRSNMTRPGRMAAGPRRRLARKHF